MTVRTPAKARLTSVAIPIRDLDCHQNLIICSLARCQPSLKFPSKSVRNFFLHKVANKQTTRAYISSLADVKNSVRVCMHICTKYCTEAFGSRSLPGLELTAFSNLLAGLKREGGDGEERGDEDAYPLRSDF